MSDLLSYLKIIQKWWWVIVLLCGATVGTMFVISFSADSLYRSRVIIQFSAPPPQEVPLYSEFGRQAINDEIEQNRSSFNAILLAGDVVHLALESLPDIELDEDELLENITVENDEEDIQLMQVNVLAPEPETAALLANAIVEIGLQRYGELRAQPTVNARLFIERQLKSAQTELNSAEIALGQFQINNKIGTLDKALDGQYDIIRGLRIQRDIARAEGNPVKAQAFEEIILEHEAELQNLIGLAPQYNELRDRVERTRTTVEFLLDRQVEAQIKENQILDVGFVQIITPARPSRRPVAVIDNRIIVLGAVGSILIGILLVFFLEALEKASASRNPKKNANLPETIILPDSAG